MAGNAHHRNRCPRCCKVEQCRCPGPKVETTNLCRECASRREPPTPSNDSDNNPQRSPR